LKILEENLIADYADDSDLIGHKKIQKTSAFVSIPLGLRTDRRRKISHEFARMDTDLFYRRERRERGVLVSFVYSTSSALRTSSRRWICSEDARLNRLKIGLKTGKMKIPGYNPVNSQSSLS
jgi:hypothetical protein